MLREKSHFAVHSGGDEFVVPFEVRVQGQVRTGDSDGIESQGSRRTKDLVGKV
jgi:hypothetical protein